MDAAGGARDREGVVGAAGGARDREGVVGAAGGASEGVVLEGQGTDIDDVRERVGFFRPLSSRINSVRPAPFRGRVAQPVTADLMHHRSSL